MNAMHSGNLTVLSRPSSVKIPDLRYRIQKYMRWLLQQVLLFPVLRFYSKSFTICGLKNLESIDGPCVYVANHSSHADTGIILLALPEARRTELSIAAAADYFYRKKWIGAFFTLLLNTFAFDRKQPLMGFRKSREILRKGSSLLIFPEGTRTDPLAHHHFKPGFALLARQLGVPVVPIGIEGGYEMLPKGTSWPRKARVRISFGEPIYPAGQSVEELAQTLEKRVRALAEVA